MTPLTANRVEGDSILPLTRRGERWVVVGYFVASSWGLPRYICKAILQHHELNVAGGGEENINILIAALKVAENIVSRTRRLIDDPDWERFQDFALTQLGMSEPDYEDLEADVAELLG